MSPPSLAVSASFYNGADWEHWDNVPHEEIAEPPSKRSDVEIYFLPDVSCAEIQTDPIFRRKLSETFAISDFFWSEAGWKANGFYESNFRPDGQKYSTSSRFLFKELQPNVEAKEYKYEWQYLAFATLWYRPDHAAHPTQILLCFGLSDKIKEQIESQIFAKPPSDWVNCPYGVYSVLANAIVRCIDSALWGYREPIRLIESTRPPINNINSLSREDMQRRYLTMHELSRHTIHMTECLDAAARTLQSIVTSRRGHCESNYVNAGASLCSQDSTQRIEFYEKFLEYLQLRSNAFDRRLQTEITLSYNLLAADDNATAKDILRESKNDGKQLTSLVSNMTILFLPATFFSSFFGMNFFDYDEKAIKLSHNLWLFFIFAVPVTLLAWALRAWFKQPPEERKRLLTLGRSKKCRWRRESTETDERGEGGVAFGRLQKSNTFPMPLGKV